MASRACRPVRSPSSPALGTGGQARAYPTTGSRAAASPGRPSAPPSSPPAPPPRGRGTRLVPRRAGGVAVPAVRARRAGRRGFGKVEDADDLVEEPDELVIVLGDAQPGQLAPQVG